MNIVAWIRPWDGDDSDLGNMLAEPVIDEDTTPPADNHQWFACVLHSDALAAIKQAQREVLDEVLRGLRSERDTTQLRAIIASVEYIRARGGEMTDFEHAALSAQLAAALVEQARREAEIATWAKAGAQRNLDVEQARREEREACESLARDMFNRAATGDEIADAIRARGEGK